MQDPLGIRQPDVFHDLQRKAERVGFGLAFVDDRNLRELVADPHCRIERSHRLLIDHRDFAASYIAELFRAQRAQVASLELYGAADDPAVDSEILHDAERDGRFAAAGLSHQPHGFSGPNHA